MQNNHLPTKSHVEFEDNSNNAVENIYPPYRKHVAKLQSQFLRMGYPHFREAPEMQQPEVENHNQHLKTMCHQ